MILQIHTDARGPMTHGSKHKRLVGALAGASYPERSFAII